MGGEKGISFSTLFLEVERKVRVHSALSTVNKERKAVVTHRTSVDDFLSLIFWHCTESPWMRARPVAIATNLLPCVLLGQKPDSPGGEEPF